MDWYLSQNEDKTYFKTDYTYVMNFDTNRWHETNEEFDWEWYENQLTGTRDPQNRRMTYLNGIVTKYFPKNEFIPLMRQRKEKIKILNTIHPNYIIDYVRKEGCEYYTYKYINGYSGKHYIKNNGGADYVKRKIANFFKNTYQDLLPYAKITYQLSDIVADNHNISLIDWEDVYKPTEEEKQKDLIKINKLFEFNRRVSVGGSYEYWNGTTQFHDL